MVFYYITGTLSHDGWTADKGGTINYWSLSVHRLCHYVAWLTGYHGYGATTIPLAIPLATFWQIGRLVGNVKYVWPKGDRWVNIIRSLLLYSLSETPWRENFLVWWHLKWNKGQHTDDIYFQKLIYNDVESNDVLIFSSQTLTKKLWIW